MPHQTRQRNSAIELLRIIAMCGIVFHHGIVHNADDVTVFGESPTRYLLESCGVLIGKVAVCLFFVISIWFLADRRLTFRDSCRRVWILERELLCYSVLCYAVGASLLGTFSPVRLVARLLPVLTGQWWFVSDYVLLMLAMPFLTAGLRALPRRGHGLLAAGMAAFFGFAQYLPHVGWALVDQSAVMGVLTLAVVTCYWRWHGRDALAASSWCNGRGRAPMAGAVALAAAMLALCHALHRAHVPGLSAVAARLWVPMQDWHSLPVIVIALGVFMMVAETRPRRWPFVDRIAASTLAIYLITDAPEIRTLLWTRLFAWHEIARWPAAVGVMMIVAVGLCAVCVAVDQLRRMVFAMTVDRHPGKWFDAMARSLGWGAPSAR